MIGGLPLDTWVLMLASTLPALALVVAAYLVHRGVDLGKGGAGGSRRGDGPRECAGEAGRSEGANVGRRPRRRERTGVAPMGEASANGAIITVLVLYFSFLIGIAWWASRESRSVAGFYVAGKKLPSWVIAFSSNTTGESGWLLLGLTGMGYLVGFHALWVVLGEVIGVALAWSVVARPYKEFTDRYDAITVPDYLSDRFADRAHIIRFVSAVIIFSMVWAYTSAQLTASGKAFSSFLGTSYEAGVLIGAGVIFLYTSIGGFKAVAYSDVLQGVLMFLCLLVLPIVGIRHAGGWGELMAAIGAADPALLKPMGEHGVTLTGVMSAVSFVGIGLAFLGAPQLLTRFMSARGRGEILGGRGDGGGVHDRLRHRGGDDGDRRARALPRPGRPRDGASGDVHRAVPGRRRGGDPGGGAGGDHVDGGFAADSGVVGGCAGRGAEGLPAGLPGPETVADRAGCSRS